MFEVNQTTLGDYFRGPGREFAAGLGLEEHALNHATVQTLAWGVSNVVIRVDSPSGSFVVKQSRHQLRTQIDWFSRLDRIWREVDVMRALAACVPVGSIPQVLFEDRANYLYGMEAIAADHRVWKGELLAGFVDVSVARELGTWLAQVHRQTSDRADLMERLCDRVVFDELRLDPFYRYVATHDERVRAELESLIAHSLARQDCLVLADFSPKNILLTNERPVVVDFETGHYGDPGFDIGFFLSHVLLKTVRNRPRADGQANRMLEYLELARVFWQEYHRTLLTAVAPAWASDVLRSPTFEAQCVRHLAACMLARVDGKSRVDYLSPDDVPLVREFCHALLHDRVPSINEAFERIMATAFR